MTRQLGPRKGSGTGSAAARGWHYRGYLPHCDVPRLQMITYRLADALPLEVIERYIQEARDDADRRMRMEAYLDAGHGSCILRHPRVAASIETAWRVFDGDRHDLAAWVVMPNHVHLLIDVYPEHSVPRILHSWKSYTAKEINRIAGRRGRVWFPDYWDRFIRNERHFAAAVEYIHGNPVGGGLVAREEDWPWSSARLYAAAP